MQTIHKGTTEQAEQAFKVASAKQQQLFDAMDAGQHISDISEALKNSEADCWWAWQVIRNGRVSEGFGSFYPARAEDLTEALCIIKDSAR